MSIEDQEKKFKRALTRKISARNKKLNKKVHFLKYIHILNTGVN